MLISITSYVLKVKKVGTVDNPIDFFTKSASFNKFKYCFDLQNIDSYVFKPFNTFLVTMSFKR